MIAETEVAIMHGAVAIRRSEIVHLTNKEELSLTKRLAFDFFAESGLPGQLNFPYWLDRWQQLFDLGIGTVIVYRTGDEIKGIMGGLCVNCTMTGDLEGIEAFWYVDPKYRGTPVGIKLLKAYEDWVKSKGAKRVKMVHLESINADMLHQVYLRMGYSMLERCYSKEL